MATPLDSLDALEADRALVSAVLAREPWAFNQLVRQYQGLVWHVVDRMVRHPDDTRELCQDVFLRVHRSVHQYRGESALKSWIAQVAYSVALRHLERKRIPIMEEVGDDDASPMAERVADGFDLEAAMVNEESARHLHAAMAALPPLQRTLLTLYHLEEMPIGDMALVTGLAEGTIKSHLFRSRKRLRAILETRMGVPA
ncbi:sigma-70 family RNA polymerase sigma factor [Luteibacter flocculans]|uniref:Sigma-70 family RNA polymerase sigma factor n=1 Tax=Luteibacter flocculans TaxID=2780091 RepID=A0ABY4T6L9_9GAMM|nr:sigma-70 family RNA polymerase sigma factor [Luteibacter flocculans]URL58539.1 sigma-70 family RNA polymerase sigma factor [Luteibacter flocculans]